MRIPWIFRPARENRSQPRNRRARSARLPELERLELRTPLSVGLLPSLASGALPQSLPALITNLSFGAEQYGRAPRSLIGSAPIAWRDTAAVLGALESNMPFLGVGRPDLAVPGGAGPFSPYVTFASSTAFSFSPGASVAAAAMQQAAGAKFLAAPREGTMVAADFFAETSVEVTTTAGWTTFMTTWFGAVANAVPVPLTSLNPGLSNDLMSSQDAKSEEFDTGTAYPPPYPVPAPGAFLFFAPRFALVRAELDASVLESGFGVPVPPTSPNASGVFVGVIPTGSSGRSAGLSQQGVAAGSLTQIDASAEASTSGWMSYVATGGWSVPNLQITPSGTKVRSDLEDAPETPTSPFSVTAMEPFSSLLSSGPDLPALGAGNPLQQVAELVPSDESSLALVATLWTTVPSWEGGTPGGLSETRDVWTPAGLADAADAGSSGEAANGPMRPMPASTAPAPWIAYMIGLEYAFEQSCRDLHWETATSLQPGTQDRGAAGVRDEACEWNRPIFVGPMGAVSGAPDEARETSARTAIDPASGGAQAGPARALPSSGIAVELRDAGSPAVVDISGTGRRLSQAALVPVIATVSLSALAVGWFWARNRGIAPPAPSGPLRHARALLGRTMPRLFPRACRSLP
jgi:hypothetical protein